MSRRADRYLHAWEASMGPDSDAAARNLATLRQRLASGEHIEDADEPIGGRESEPEPEAEPEPAPRWSRAAAAIFYLKAGAISVAIGTSTLAALHGAAVLVRPDPPRPASLPVPAPAPPQPARPSPPAPAHAEAVPARTPVMHSAEREVPTPRSDPGSQASAPEPAEASASASVADRLRAEIDLMARAERALLHGDDASLLRILEQHRAAFEDGAMIEEREAWTAVAACRTARADARRLASRFLAAHPSSAQAPRVRRACEQFSSTELSGSRDERP